MYMKSLIKQSEKKINEIKDEEERKKSLNIYEISQEQKKSEKNLEA